MYVPLIIVQLSNIYYLFTLVVVGVGVGEEEEEEVVGVVEPLEEELEHLGVGEVLRYLTGYHYLKKKKKICKTEQHWKNIRKKKKKLTVATMINLYGISVSHITTDMFYLS